MVCAEGNHLMARSVAGLSHTPLPESPLPNTWQWTSQTLRASRSCHAPRTSEDCARAFGNCAWHALNMPARKSKSQPTSALAAPAQDMPRKARRFTRLLQSLVFQVIEHVRQRRADGAGIREVSDLLAGLLALEYSGHLQDLELVR